MDLVVQLTPLGCSVAENYTLSTDGRAYYIKNSCHLSWRTPSAYTSPFQEDVFPGIEAQESFLQRAAMQTETLLYLAQRLQLQPLMDRMHAFIASSTYRTDGILYGRLEDVFTERVLSVSLPPGASDAARMAWISSVLTLPFGFVNECYVNQLLKIPNM